MRAYAIDSAKNAKVIRMKIKSATAPPHVRSPRRAFSPCAESPIPATRNDTTRLRDSARCHVTRKTTAPVTSSFDAAGAMALSGVQPR